VRCWVNGEWIEAESKQVTEIRNPATGEVVDTVPRCGAKETQRAIDAAAAAFPAWSATSTEERGRILMKAAEIVKAKMKDLAPWLTKEQGKPIRDAELEIGHFLHGLEYYGGLVSKMRSDFVPLPGKNMHGVVMRRPLGVCGAIVPWNFPITLMGNKIGPGLAAGNTFVVKPASSTPLCSIAVIEAMHEAGIPKGVLNIVTGPGGEVGEELVQNPRVVRIGFTGETVTGRHVGEVAGRHFKRVSLELGGSDPCIVCDDADLDKAAPAVAIGRFFNCGQACLAVKRLYVFAGVYDAFVEKLVGRANRLKLGNGMEKETQMGPLHTAGQLKEVEEQVSDAVRRGAKVVAGGGRPEGPEYAKGHFYKPTVLVDVPEDARVATEETFGPILPIWKVKDLDEALAKANNHVYGLGSSIWTRDMTKAAVAAERLEAGNVWVNSLHYGHDEMPFGGVKQSGIGREHGIEALLSYTETKGVVYTML